MCEKKYYGTRPYNRIDKCMRPFIKNLNQGMKGKFELLACCCGHGKYPITIVARNKKGQIFDLVSNKDIPRKRKFYKRDPQGHYYIPETIQKDNEQKKTQQK